MSKNPQLQQQFIHVPVLRVDRKQQRCRVGKGPATACNSIIKITDNRWDSRLCCVCLSYFLYAWLWLLVRRLPNSPYATITQRFASDQSLGSNFGTIIPTASVQPTRQQKNIAVRKTKKCVRSCNAHSIFVAAVSNRTHDPIDRSLDCFGLHFISLAFVVSCSCIQLIGVRF